MRQWQPDRVRSAVPLSAVCGPSVVWLGLPGGRPGRGVFRHQQQTVSSKSSWVKWFIWTPWLILIVVIAVRAGGSRQVDFFHLTDSGISVDEPQRYAIYYTVIALFAGLAVLLGRRAGCHTICWMAPFMILGRKLRHAFRWPSLRLVAEREVCIDCKRCTQNCPMSLDVNGMVQGNTMEHSQCSLCGSCVDTCPKDVIRHSFSAGK
jgi:ferredoxin-type protein NapH